MAIPEENAQGQAIKEQRGKPALPPAFVRVGHFVFEDDTASRFVKNVLVFPKGHWPFEHAVDKGCWNRPWFMARNPAH